MLEGRIIAAVPDVRPNGVQNDQFAMDLPITCRLGKRRGSLLIGPRLDGCSYGKDDTEALRMILPALGRAILAARESEAARRRVRGFQRRLREQLSTMSARLKHLEGLVNVAD